jgi:hypothetical protein
MPEHHRILFREKQRFARGAFDPRRLAQPEVQEIDPVAQREAGGVRVIDLPGPSQTVFARSSSLIGKPQVPEDPALVVRRRCVRVVAEATGEVARRNRILEVERPLDELQSSVTP